MNKIYKFLQASLNVYARTKFFQTVGMPLPDVELYKAACKDVSKYYSTKLSYSLQQRALNRNLQKLRRMAALSGSNSGMKI